jgi:hypothetical protein
MARMTALLWLVAANLCVAQERTANPADVGTIAALMKAYYESVSGPPGLRDGERMLSLFIEGGKISIDLTGNAPTHKLAEDYLRSERFLTITEDFYEQEIARQTQVFGDMAHVVSSYGISDSPDNRNFRATGVTFFQLIRHGDRWWILSTLWQRASDDNPLPPGLRG